MDGDGDLDLYVANDGEPNRLYDHREGDGALGVTFVDITGDAGVGDSGSGMGVAGGVLSISTNNCSDWVRFPAASVDSTLNGWGPSDGMPKAP